MCKALSPASFLAIAFDMVRRDELGYDWLNVYRSFMQSRSYNGERVDVLWDHDAVNYTMGFFSPLFSCAADGVHCDLESLDVYFEELTCDLDKKLLGQLRKCAMDCDKKNRLLENERAKVH